MKLPRRSSTCKKCQKSFDFGDSYISQVVEEERSDYCLVCWEKTGPFWQGKIPLRAGRSPDEKALQLFRNREEFRYLLALYLERRKELAHRPQLSKKDMQCYELLETGELFHVAMGSVQQEVIDELAAVLEN